MNDRQRHLLGFTGTRLTAPGRGAVACVRLSCDASDQARSLDSVFVAANGMVPSKAAVNRVLFGSWQGEDVVVVRIGETEWEVQCHGGEAAVSRILRQCDTQDEAHPGSILEELLLRTRTTRTAQFVLSQSNGVLRDALLTIATAATTESFQQHWQELLHWRDFARHLVEPRQVVIAGPPNVGKSSLLNAIAGYERAIVFDQPGTTRDAVHTELVLDGWPFAFVDTAGIRQQTDDPIEVLGISSARTLLAKADAVLIAVDSTIGWTPEHDNIRAHVSPCVVQGIVCCKGDLQTSQINGLPDGPRILMTAAEQGEGIRELTDWVTQQLVPEVPELRTPLPVAGVAECGQQQLRQLEQGDPLKIVQARLVEWVNSSGC